MANTTTKETTALATLYELAGMLTEQIDEGISAHHDLAPMTEKDTALFLVALTMHHHQVDTEVRDLVRDAFGITPNFPEIEAAFEDVTNNIRTHRASFTPLDMDGQDKAWVRGILLGSPVITSLIYGGHVKVPITNLHNTDPSPEGALVRYTQQLVDACQFNERDLKLIDYEMWEMGAYASERFDSLLRMIDRHDPHLPLHPFAQPDPRLQRWIDNNAPDLHMFNPQMQQTMLIAVLGRGMLAAVDPNCGGVNITEYARACLKDSAHYATAIVDMLPVTMHDDEAPIAYMDNAIAYLGSHEAARAMGIDRDAVMTELHELCHVPATASAATLPRDNWAARVILGVQRAGIWELDDEPLSPMGRMILRKSLARETRQYWDRGYHNIF